jgi:hypothetical protein
MANVRFDSTWQKYAIKDLSGGLNVDTSIVQPNELLIVDNCDLQIYGAISKRGGWRKLNATARTVTNANGGIKTLFNYAKNVSGSFEGMLLAAHDGKIIKANPAALPADRLVFTSFTELVTGLTATDQYSIALLANRAIISSLNHSLWTEGATVYGNSTIAPSIPTYSVVASGGKVTIGSYLVAYSYLKSGNHEYETNMGPSATVVVAANDSHIHVTVVASVDPQIDKIRIYCSSPGGSVMYRQTEVANAAATVDIGVTTLLAGTVGQEDNFAPPKAKFIYAMANRVFYAYTDDAGKGSSTVKWSHTNDPHSVGADNWAEFNAEDGEAITGIGELLNYLVVFKRNAIFLLDVFDFNIINISGSEGCVANGSIQSTHDGKMIVFLSESGVRIFDGQTMSSLSDLKINTLVCANLDNVNLEKQTVSLYARKQMRYSLLIPTQSDGYLWLNYYFKGKGGWTTYTMLRATAMCLTTDKDGGIVPLASYYSGTSAYIAELDYGSSDDGAAIPMVIKTVAHDLGMVGVAKQIRRCDFEWLSATFETIVDFGMGSGVVKKVSHEGSTFWGSFSWGQAFWGQSGRTVDRIDLKGKGQNFEFAFRETSIVPIVVYGMNFLFYPVSYQGTPDAQ